MALVQVVYNGPFDEVNVPSLGLESVIKGEPVSVDQADADLLCQQAIWSVVKPSAPAPKPVAPSGD